MVKIFAIFIAALASLLMIKNVEDSDHFILYTRDFLQITEHAGDPVIISTDPLSGNIAPVQYTCVQNQHENIILFGDIAPTPTVITVTGDASTLRELVHRHPELTPTTKLEFIRTFCGQSLLCSVQRIGQYRSIRRMYFTTNTLVYDAAIIITAGGSYFASCESH